MRRNVLRPGIRPRFAMGFAMSGLVAAGLLLTGCSAVDSMSGGAGSVLSGDFTGGQDDPNIPKVDPSIFAVQKYCPPIEVRGDAHVIDVYARNQEGDPEGLRYQATLRKWARECTHSGDTMTIKVGMVGRLVAGPAGIDGPVKLPLRIVVTGTEKDVIASELFAIEASVTAADQTEPWSTVIDTITVPAAGAAKIYIGFDDKTAGKRR